jgi:hypothetical protein
MSEFSGRRKDLEELSCSRSIDSRPPRPASCLWLSRDCGPILVTCDKRLIVEGYHNISSLAPGVDVPMGLADLLERVAPINNGFELSRLSQLCKEAQVD